MRAFPALVLETGYSQDLYHGESFLRDGDVSQAYRIDSGPFGPQVQLTYNSLTAEAKPLVTVHTKFKPPAPVPNSVVAQLIVKDSADRPLVEGPEVYYHTNTFAPGDEVRFVLQADMREQKTGRYAFELELISFHTLGPYLSKFLGSLDVVNQSVLTAGGEYLSNQGIGWGVSGLHRLHKQADGVLLTGGDGSAVWFQGIGPYTSPPGIFATLSVSGGEFTLKDKFNTRWSFNSAGLLTSRKDRNNNTTSYTYVDADGDGAADEIDKITGPYGRTFTFAYDSAGFLDSITDHAGRVTDVVNDGAGHIAQIAAPDPDAGGSLSRGRKGGRKGDRSEWH